MNRENLASLMRGIHHAASSTHAMLAQQYMHMLKQFFDEKDGKLMAKMTYVQIDDEHWIPVPLISLVTPRGLALDRMKVEMSLRIEESEVKQATIDEDGSHAERLALQVAISPKTKGSGQRPTDVTDIEIEFKAGDPPEALMRLIDAYPNQIDPRQFERTEPPMDRYPHTSINFTGKKLKAADGKNKDQGED